MVSPNLDAGSFLALDPPLTPWMKDAISTMGFTRMTPVQASVIPLFMKNKDVVVEAVTGSGKTLSFVIPIIERLLRRETPLAKYEVGAIIVTPTRELAAQIHSVVASFLDLQTLETPADEATNADDSQSRPQNSPATQEGTSKPTSSSSIDRRLRPPLLLIGGGGGSAGDSTASAVSSFRAEGADILIGTPGRLEEFLLGKSSMSQNKMKGRAGLSVAKAANGSVRSLVSLKALEVLVLDEADRLLDLGFAPVLTSILSALPKQRRTGLFSATMTTALASLIRVGLRNPVKVVVRTTAIGSSKGKQKQVTSAETEGNAAPNELESGYVVVPEGAKLAQLQRILRFESRQEQGRTAARKVIVFFATCAEVDHWYRILTRLSAFSAFSFHSLHGSLPPPRRQATYTAFTTSLSINHLSVLLTTDVAARGLDVPEVDLVIQMEPPSDPRIFAHRVGRTARAGRSGKAVAMLRSGREEEYAELMRVRKMPLKRFPYLNDDLKSVQDALPSGTDDAASALNEQVSKVILSDRALHESAVKAFVSNVRFYTKHEAAYIFRIADLDLVAIAMSMGIIRLPKMPELQKVDGPEGGWLRNDFAWDAYAYADKIREKQRLEALSSGNASIKRRADESEAKPQPLQKKMKTKSTPWSAKADKKAAKEEKRQKKAEKRRMLAEQRATEEGNGNDGEEEGEEAQQDWKELVKEKAATRKKVAAKGQNAQAAVDTPFFEGLT